MKSPCPQCGGEVHLRDAEGFPTCPFCGVGLVLDRTGVRPHLLYRPRIASTQVTALVRRWAERRRQRLASGATAPRLVYYPFWRYAREGPRRLIPAWSTLEPEWDTLRLPDAEQVFFDASHVGDADVIQSSVPEASARARAFGEASVPPGDLVHVPFYETTVRLGEIRRSVGVEACTGTVVCPGLEALGARTPTMARRTGWMLCVGVVMLAAALAIRPLGVVVVVVGVTTVLLYGILVSERGSGG